MQDSEMYKRLHAEWMSDRVDACGALPQEDEAKWAAKMEELWVKLSEPESTALEEWLERQHQWRRENDVPLSGDGFQLSPEELAQIIFQGEYELIIAEDDDCVVFQISGSDVTIKRGVILDYDEEGRYWLAREDAERMGLLQ